MTVSLSVVVPVKDEAENVTPLLREIAAAVTGEVGHEIIFVDDGSSDGTPGILEALKAEVPALRVLVHDRNIGQSRAIRTGVRAARGEIVVTMDGDGQNDPADIPRLLASLREGRARGVGLVSGVRVNRKDNAWKKFQSGLANRYRRWRLKDGARDVGCSLKAFPREVFLALPYFDNMHRFLIALVRREGYDVRFVDVNHRPRRHGHSKYNGLGRFFVGIRDVAGVRWLTKRYRGPAAPREL